MRTHCYHHEIIKGKGEKIRASKIVYTLPAENMSSISSTHVGCLIAAHFKASNTVLPSADNYTHVHITPHRHI